MRCLGIDYGSKRIGLAVSDDERRIAFPYKILDNGGNTEELLKDFRKIIHDELVDELILGLPLSFSGQDTPQTREARKFGEELRKLHLPLVFQNEILTTKSAKGGAGKGFPDASAAALILQDYLDKKK
mgnify:CR=1 FL=1